MAIKTISSTTAFAAVAIALALSPSAQVTAAQVKVDVCHVTNVPEEGDGHVISIADPAWDAHAEHGDKKVGEPGVTVYEDGTDTRLCHVSTALVAVNDEVTTPMDTPVTTYLLANDIYVEPVNVSVQEFPMNGLLGPFNEDNGTITYTPNTDFFGTDSFTYQICDTDGQCDTATVTINVGP